MNWVPAELQTTATKSINVAVIGAGITGLATAHRLASQKLNSDSGLGISITVFEASDRIGGIVRTVKRDGFLVEMGPDSFITNKPGAIDLCREIGFLDHLIPTDESWRRSLVLRNGKPRPVPEGFMLMAPGSPWAILTTPVLSLPGKLRLLAEAFVRAKKSEDDESLASFVRRRFGQEALERLVQPLVGGIYTSDPEKLSLEATLPRFPEMERQHGSVIRATLRQKKHPAGGQNSGSGARYALFLTAREGLSQMMDAVAQACSETGRVTWKLNQKIESLTRVSGQSSDAASSALLTSEGWNVQLQGESAPRHFDAVVITLPTHAAANLLVDKDCQSLCTSLRAIEYASSAIVVSGHRLSDFQHPLDAFGLVIPDLEDRKILAVSFSSRKFPGRAPDGHVLLRTFVGGAMQPELLNHDDDTILRMVSDELKSILGMSGTPVFSSVVRYNNAMPQYHVGHNARVQTIEQQCDALKGLYLAGSAYHGVGIPDSIASGRDAADRILLQFRQPS